MTKLYEGSIDDNPYPDRKALRNFTWTTEALGEWEDIWHELWHLGYKWEWQNSDRYARHFGERFNLYSCHNDAVRLDMAIPLPGLVVIYEIRESLLDDPGDDQRLDHVVGAIDAWLKKHYTPA
tara:strand:+ start:446 stop:814 length:369 start_codon:yes stop_codon:yes gene_type:complete